MKLDITSSYAERHKLFTLAEQYGLDVIAIARRTFELIFKEIESAVCNITLCCFFF